MKNNKRKVKQTVIGLGMMVSLLQALLPGIGAAQDSNNSIIRQCKTCHGSDGMAKIPIAPHIAGEPAGYLLNQLLAFKTGTRQHEMMSVVTQALDQQELETAAQWYAAQPFNITPPEAQAPNEIEPCIQCHGVNGLGTNPDIPHLAGESVIYLDTQLKSFRSGKRTHPDMSEIAKQLSDDAIRQAAQWYSAIQLQTGE